MYLPQATHMEGKEHMKEEDMSNQQKDLTMEGWDEVAGEVEEEEAEEEVPAQCLLWGTFQNSLTQSHILTDISAAMAT